MPILEFFQAYPAVYVASSLVLGLLVGSFLNVVAHRLPLMLEREWRSQCHELLGTEEPHSEQAAETVSLTKPRSRCPLCGHRIRAWENIPVVSYILLRGHCSNCGGSISPRYPIVEALTGVLTAWVAWHFGVTAPETLPALLLTWALISLALIDIDTQLLPDSITLPLLWAGLLLSLVDVFTDTRSAIIGAAVGYLFLWTVYWLFKHLTGKEGMGYGDFKLLAVFGAWIGWHYLPQILFLATVGGALLAPVLTLARRRTRGQPIPFGPYLALAGWVALMWGNVINTAYLSWSGLTP
jgi:leader peptidase (prepilin peptidase)/N-methyltransferase